MAKIKDIIKNPKFYLIVLYGRILPRNINGDKKYLEVLFKHLMKKKLNLNNPKTFNEKLQWIKLYDRKDIYTTMVDKYEAKEFAKKIIGEEYIIPTLGVWDKFDDIDFDKLPNQFVLKCTHDSGGLVIVTDKGKFDKKSAKKKINHCLKRNYYLNTREWPYKNVKPRIIAEPYLVDKKIGELCDYKFFVFNGKQSLLLICSNRNTEVKFTFFDKNKKRLKIRQCGAENDLTVSLPDNYDKMVQLAEKLSKGTIEVRVDFYEINGKVYFGELTFFDSGGFGFFSPEEWDRKIGNMIDLENVNE